MPIQWSDKYSTGVKIVDNQHQQLFALIDILGEASQASPSKEVIEKALDFLETYVKSHFAYEEVCMALRKCSVADKNIEAHKKFLESFQEFKERFKKDGATSDLLKEIQSVSENWLVKHICSVDTTLRQQSDK